MKPVAADGGRQTGPEIAREAVGGTPGSPNSTAQRTSAWRALVRQAVFMVLLCSGIAVLLTAMDGHGFGTKLVYSFSIGLCCWLPIQGGRWTISSFSARRRAAIGLPPLPDGHYTGWRWMLPLMGTGIVLGPMGGTALADWLTGRVSPSLFNPGASGVTLTLVLSVLGSALALFALSSMERLASARAATEAAQRLAAENQLKLLESQLEPHMLFNTLANLRVLIGIDPPQAQAMLDRMIGFLRATLDASRAGMHPLAAEFERIDDYLTLIAIRMGPRLRVALDLPDELRSLPVPPLLLQPLVENSIKHGLEPKVEGGRVEVRAQRIGPNLVLSVRDTGLGLEGARPETAGTRFGLQQVRARLRTLYGDAARLTIESAPDAEGGALATLTLPLPAEPKP